MRGLSAIPEPTGMSLLPDVCPHMLFLEIISKILLQRSQQWKHGDLFSYPGTSSLVPPRRYCHMAKFWSIVHHEQLWNFQRMISAVVPCVIKAPELHPQLHGCLLDDYASLLVDFIVGYVFQRVIFSIQHQQIWQWKIPFVTRMKCHVAIRNTDPETILCPPLR